MSDEVGQAALPGEVNLRLDRDDRGVLTIAFDAPRTRNAMNRATRVAFVEELQRADADPEVRVILVTGTDPAFSSGVDAKEFLGSADYVKPAIDPATALRALTTPTIAAVNGACVSGALEIAIACSFAIASDRARFADTHTRLGLTPGWGLGSDLPALIGPARARRLALTAEAIDAPTALAWGIVTEVVPHEELMPRANGLADAILAIPDPAAVRAVLRLHREAQDAVLAGARAAEAAATVRRDAERRAG